MASDSSIEWTDSTWNPLTGCTKISPGCAHCYAERMSVRLQAMGNPNYKNGFDLTLHEHALELPLGWKKPRRIFVNSMSDLFHKDVPADFVRRAFDVMYRADWHRFQILTKRSDRLAELSPQLPWADHIWQGVSVESEKYLSRIDHLRRTGARPMKAEWVTDIRDRCRAAGVPFFFKQWGGFNKKKTGRMLEGRTWDEMPTPPAV